MSQIRMRHMVPADVAKVQHLAAEQNERDGTSYPVPQVFDAQGRQLANVPLALVAVDDEGEVLQAHVFQRTIEMCSFGDDPRALSVSLDAIAGVCFLLEQRGYTDMHVQVPLQKHRKLDRFGKAVAKALTRIGFTRDDNRLAHFYRYLKAR